MEDKRVKLLWLVNVKLPVIDEVQNKQASVNVGGWLTGLYESLTINNEISQIMICYPTHDSTEKEFISGKLHAIPFVYSNEQTSEKIDKYFTDLLHKYEPDIIHIHGSEFSYSLAMSNAAEKCNQLDRVVCSIQGMVSVYAHHYYAALPDSVVRKKTIVERLRGTALEKQKIDYEKRGFDEIALLKKVKHVVGRTSWDRACTWIINPESHYHFCNEILRSSFYDGKWRYDQCRPHTIMLSQGAKPIKGLHIVLDALKIVKEYYPDVKVVVAGNNILAEKNKSSYARYIEKQISEGGLSDNITFTGNLNEQEMKNNMLKSNVFVLPSSIENSPNSLGEAMLLGLPCIASDVGGVLDMMRHEEEGIVYPFNEFYKLAYEIIRVFRMKTDAEKMGIEAAKHARVTHSATLNAEKMMSIYREIIDEAH